MLPLITYLITLPFSIKEDCIFYAKDVANTYISKSDSVQPYALQPARGASVHGILQARILEWVAMPSSRGFS